MYLMDCVIILELHSVIVNVIDKIVTRGNWRSGYHIAPYAQTQFLSYFCTLYYVLLLYYYDLEIYVMDRLYLL